MRCWRPAREDAMSTNPSTPLSDADLADYHRLAVEVWRTEGADETWIERSAS
jgi:hypothetical protein